MAKKLMAEEDKLKGKLPYLKDYQKHYYGTVALATDGPAKGLLLTFPSSTMVEEDSSTPHLAYAPMIRNGVVSYNPKLGVKYDNLAPYFPIKYGWYQFFGNAIHVSAIQKVQWKVGLCNNNANLSCFMPRMPQYLRRFEGEKFTASRMHGVQFLSTFVAAINTYGIDKIWCDPEEHCVENWDHDTSKDDAVVLGENLFYGAGRVFLAPSTDPIAIVHKNGTVYTYKSNNKKIVEKILGWENVKKCTNTQWRSLYRYRKLSPPAKDKETSNDARFNAFISSDPSHSTWAAAALKKHMYFGTPHPKPTSSPSGLENILFSSSEVEETEGPDNEF